MTENGGYIRGKNVNPQLAASLINYNPLSSWIHNFKILHLITLFLLIDFPKSLVTPLSFDRLIWNKKGNTINWSVLPVG